MTIALGGCLRAPPVAYGITEDTGGHITYVLGAADTLSRNPNVARVDIVTRRFEHSAYGAIHAQAEEWISPRLRIVRIQSGNPDYLAKEDLARDRPGFLAALLDHLADPAQRPDIIHAHFADAADVAAQVREVYGIPFIYTAHSLGADKCRADGHGLQLAARLAEEDRAIAAADAIIASSRDECERQLMAYPSARAGRINRLRPGIAVATPSASDLASARGLIAPFLRDPDRPMVLSIARPVQKKNLLTLVEAYAGNQVLRERTNLVLLAGLRSGLLDGEAEQREVMLGLVDAIDRHDLHGQIAWPRSHTRAHVDALYALARRSGGVFVNPALVEPYGLTLIEAAAHGLPVVATREGGPQDIVAELEHGTLVDPRSPAEIGAAAAELVTRRDRWQACSTNALRNVRAMNWDSYAEGFMTLAQRLIHPRPDWRARSPERLLLSDIDNTLTGCPAGANRLARYLSRHYATTRFGVATGRSLVEARRLLLEWGLPEPDVVVSSVGTEIYWRDGDDFVPDVAFATRIAEGWDTAAIEQALAGIPGLVPQATIEQRAFKRSYFVEGPEAAPLVEAGLRAAGVRARVVFSHSRFLDVLPVNAGKGNAMHHVSQVLGLPCERVIAAGDSGNDADMLTACPGAVVVANYDEDLAEVASLDHVYRARRAHAGGVLEGLLWHTRRHARMEATDVAA
ncbi:HAD-IIB family hydrolase [Aurantiacibacter luteus]|nr:HAD-IIB family hydrolase [Aurantiacibacter luteus]